MAECFLKHNYPIIVWHADRVWQKSYELLHRRATRVLLQCCGGLVSQREQLYSEVKVFGENWIPVMEDDGLQVENDWFYCLKPPLCSLTLTWASLHSHLLFFSSQDFSVWWGQISPQRVHRGNANPPQEAEAQPNQKLQQLPGETVTCKSNVPHGYG